MFHYPKKTTGILLQDVHTMLEWLLWGGVDRPGLKTKGLNRVRENFLNKTKAGLTCKGQRVFSCQGLFKCSNIPRYVAETLAIEPVADEAGGQEGCRFQATGCVYARGQWGHMGGWGSQPLAALQVFHSCPCCTGATRPPSPQFGSEIESFQKQGVRQVQSDMVT